MTTTMLEEPRHRLREAAVANKLAAAWHCEWGAMGPYSPFDVYLMRQGVILALAEIRTRRDQGCQKYANVMIDLDKWFSLVEAELMLKMPAFYVVAFTDGVWFVRIGHLRPSEYRITYRGRRDRPQAKNDLCPVLEVPSSCFQRICDVEGVFEE